MSPKHFEIVQLVTAINQALLIGWDTLFVLNPFLQLCDRHVIRVGQSDCLARQRLDVKHRRPGPRS